MGDAIPMDWVMEVERNRDRSHRAQMDEWKRDDPEWYDAVIKYAGENPSCEQVNDTLANNKKFKEWRLERIKRKIKASQKYAFTFTTNASSDDWVAQEQAMIQACHKLYSQSTNPIKDGDCYLEYTKDKRPHVHGWYQTENGGRVYAKVFERVWKLWDESKPQGKGFQGGFHEKVKSLQYEKYASAEERKICGKLNGEFTPG